MYTQVVFVIPLTCLTPPHCCACSNPDPGSPMSYVVAQGNLGVNFTIKEDFMASGKSCSNKMADYSLMVIGFSTA
jgi:hypothetical protein